jgi:broad specificity phosphatase PhoE
MPTVFPKVIYAVASGQTAWDDQSRIQGSMDLPLSVKGRRQADQVAATWTAGPLPAVHCAPDEASRGTAEVLGHVWNCPVKIVDQLAEVHLGLWQGLTESELQERYPSAYGQWVDDPWSVLPPEGEAMAQADARLRQAMTRIVGRSSDRPVMVVLRPVMMRMVAAWLGEADQPWAASGVAAFQVTEDQWQVRRVRRAGRKVSV